MLDKLIYASIENRPFPQEELSELARIATDMNQRHGITGYLFYDNGIFFQFLEGAENELRQLMSNIREDRRHSIIRKFDLAPSDVREFPGWGMRLFDLRTLSECDMDLELEALMLRLRNTPRLAEADKDKIHQLLHGIARREHT